MEKGTKPDFSTLAQWRAVMWTLLVSPAQCECSYPSGLPQFSSPALQLKMTTFLATEPQPRLFSANFNICKSYKALAQEQ